MDLGHPSTLEILTNNYLSMNINLQILHRQQRPPSW